MKFIIYKDNFIVLNKKSYEKNKLEVFIFKKGDLSNL